MLLLPQQKRSIQMPNSKKPVLRRNPQRFPKAVREAVSVDYISKLTAEEREYLAAFNEAEFGGNAEALELITGKPVTQADKRKAWRNLKRKQRDALNQYNLPLETLDFERSSSNHEDTLIDLIDIKAAFLKRQKSN